MSRHQGGAILITTAGLRWVMVMLLSAAAIPGASVAQPTSRLAAQAGGPTGQPGLADPIVASVEGHQIRLSDVARATQTLPANLRSLPFDTLYPILLERMVDHQALVRMADRRGLADRPAVKKEIEAAADRVLEGAYLEQEAASKVTDQAIQLRYNQRFGARPATEEARARHILVTAEAEARDLIDQLRKGADFAGLARARSKDPDGQNGGDQGFFRRDQVWPNFADVAFSLPPGQVAPNPVHNEFGWHVVKVEERRLVGAPSFADVKDTLREELMSEAVRQAVTSARSQLFIRRFNLDGTEMAGGTAK